MPIANSPVADDSRYATYMALARECVREGRILHAIEHARGAIGHDPSRPEAFNLLGVCCEARHAPLEAQTYYRAALVFDPSYEPALRNLHRLVSYTRKGPIDPGED